MAMINLLGTAQKNDIRAARLNISLRKLVVTGMAAVIVIFGIYGIGFYFVMNEQKRAESQLSQDMAALEASGSILSEAKIYKTNLDIAKKVLASGVSYSSFITDTAKVLPAGSILTTFTLSNLGAPVTPAAQAANQLTLNVRTTDYDTALLVQKNLEESDLYEKVSLSDATTIEQSGDANATDKKYPISVTLRATASQPKNI